jgi:hypothetical protein
LPPVLRVWPTPGLQGENMRSSSFIQQSNFYSRVQTLIYDVRDVRSLVLLLLHAADSCSNAIEDVESARQRDRASFVRPDTAWTNPFPLTTQHELVGELKRLSRSLRAHSAAYDDVAALLDRFLHRSFSSATLHRWDRRSLGRIIFYRKNGRCVAPRPMRCAIRPHRCDGSRPRRPSTLRYVKGTSARMTDGFAWVAAVITHRYTGVAHYQDEARFYRRR